MIQLQHDISLEIAIGKNRRAENWANTQITWQELLNKVSQTHRTHETFNEYMAFKKDLQDDIKDVGGFVGGFLASSKRKKDNVMHRHILTLDIDHAKYDLWQDISLFYSCAAAVYSTHKHAPDSPRLRLLIPLDREVTPTEYVAISRKVASDFGIDNFDDTTFQPSRLMYWPSTPKDGVFQFDYQDGPILEADYVLGRYRNWKDASEWSFSSRHKGLVERNIKKQGNPLEKKFIVGAFCRTYTVTEAMAKFLSDIYMPTNQEDRYTYVHGSTAKGLVIYDEDKFCYSNHGTDPVSGMTCNAFDLVRNHLFGIRDEDCAPSITGTRLPSFKAMEDFCSNDPETRKRIVSERLDATASDFEEDFETSDDSWQEKIETDKYGKVHPTLANVSLILENDPMLKDKFAQDRFTGKYLLLKNVPWRKLSNEDGEFHNELTDGDETGLRMYFEKRYNISSRNNILDAFELHMQQNSFHPVRDYLKTLKDKWDGVKRVDTLLIDYQGAADGKYTRVVTRKTLVAAVARIFHPGIKFDHILMLVGPEGKGKSTIFRRLAKSWFSDSFSFGLIGKGNSAYEQVQGFWIIEAAEVAGLKKAEAEGVKSFITKEDDSYRPAFGRRSVTRKRQSIFVASSNDDQPLNDNNGNRRFLPVKIWVNKPRYDVFTSFEDSLVDQIWAEALHYFNAGEKIYLDEEMKDIAKAVQNRFTEKDSRIGLIENFLEMKLPLEWSKMADYEKQSYIKNGPEESLQYEGAETRVKVCAAEIWVELMNGQQKDMNPYNIRSINAILKSIEGWQEYSEPQEFGIYGRQMGYFRVSDFHKQLTEMHGL